MTEWKNMEKSEKYITIMGIVIVVNCVIMLAFMVYQGEVQVGTILASSVGILGGLAAIAYFKKDLILGLAFCIFIIGLSTLFADFERLMDGGNDLGSTIVSLLYVVAGCVLIYYSVSLFMGLKTGSMKGIVVLGVLCVMELFMFLSVVRKGIAIEPYDWGNLVMAIEHGLLIFLLTRNEMLLPTFLKRLKTNSETIFDNMATDPEIYVKREDVERLTNISDGPEWTHIENGPVERESIVSLQGRQVGTEIMLQKWRNDNDLHLTVRGKDSGSYRIVLSMVVKHTVMSKNDKGMVEKIRFYGQDGMFADILVFDEEEFTIGYIGTIKSKVMAAKASKQE